MRCPNAVENQADRPRRDNFQTKYRLAGKRALFEDAEAMADVQNPAKVVTTAPKWDEEMIYRVFNDSVRRHVLFTLAKQGPKTVRDLNPGGKFHDTVIKHLAVLRSAGLVTMKSDPTDGRRSIYSLSPAVLFKDTEEGRMMNFGFCMVRVD